MTVIKVVDSTAIEAYEYNPTTRQFNVEFKGGNAYAYQNVPQSVADDFTGRESKGSAYRELFMGKFSSSCLFGFTLTDRLALAADLPQPLNTDNLEQRVELLERQVKALLHAPLTSLLTD